MKNSMQCGYLIIELLVYCALIAGMILITLEWSVAHYLAANKQEQQQEIRTQLHMAHCILIRDIQQSATALSEWRQCNPNDYVWRTHDGDVGWQVHNQQLMRIQGTYNQRTATWHARSKGLVAGGVQALEIVPCNDTARVTCTLTSIHHDTCVRTVALRNGVLL